MPPAVGQRLTWFPFSRIPTCAHIVAVGSRQIGQREPSSTLCPQACATHQQLGETIKLGGHFECRSVLADVQYPESYTQDVANPLVNVRWAAREFLTKRRTTHRHTLWLLTVGRMSSHTAVAAFQHSVNHDLTKGTSATRSPPQCLHTAALADVLQRSAFKAALSRRFGCLCAAPATEGGQMSLL